ncbi:MAG TPA: hypothetical protein VJO12_00060 [Stellaceae bacterium]|nr:hypothetical protein [Stellaceae bacterium]
MNPITMLIPLGGIALILVAVWLTGGARQARLDRALVLRRLDEDLPDFAATEMRIDADAATAIARADDGALALIFVAGDKVVVRPLAAHDIRRVAEEKLDGDVRLVIDTGDFTHGRVALRLPGAEAARWQARLPTAARAA